MKFTCQVEINLPKEKVVALWKDTNNLQHWQDGFERYEHISGTPNKTGSKGILYYNNKGRPMELEEIVIEGNLPHVFEGEYIHQHMTNRMRSTFQAVGTEKTIWKAEIDYLKFNGIFIKVFALFAKGLFRKQTQKWLDQFKNFAENKN